MAKGRVEDQIKGRRFDLIASDMWKVGINDGNVGDRVK